MRDQEKAARQGAATYCQRPPNSNTETWRRVTPRDRCPICDHATWCMVSPDGAIAGCMREDLGSFARRERAGTMYLHRLRQDCRSSLRISPQARRSPPPATAATPDDRHAVYTAFLDSLTLSRHHAVELRERRGLSEETVVRNLYASVPEATAVAAAIKQLAASFDLGGVPGFWLHRGLWRCAARCGELLIPSRDEAGRIAAVLRGTDGQPKYLWMSNASSGVSSGTPIHFALPHLGDIYPGSNIFITEGVMKADVIAERLHTPVVGLPGIIFPDDLGVRLARRFPAAGTISVAFDADERSNHHVRAGMIRLLRLLDAAGLTADRLTWDQAEGKGLDDVLLGGAE